MRKLIVLTVLAVSLMVTNTSNAQGYKKYLKEFLKTQWWLGVKFGTNLTQIQVVDRYAGLSAINYENSTLEKTYDQFNLPGVQAGIDITFFHKGFSLGIQPNFRQIRYTYENSFLWEGEGANDRFETTYSQEQKIDFIDVPVMLKYDILSSTIRPYVMGGAYFSFLTNAEKKVGIEQVDYASGTAQTLDAGELKIGVKESFNNHDYGIMGGIGGSSDFWNIRTVLEVTYRYGLVKVTNEQNRYTDSQLAGIGDAIDDIRLRSININLSLLFPLRFVSSDLNAF